MGIWNVKTLLKSSKMQELVEELAKTQLEIVAIQETRWPGTRHIKKKDFSIYYSGTRDQIGQAGTGFILLGRIWENVIGFEAINEQLCKKIRLKSKYNNLTLINIYAPTEDKMDVEKERFYDDLQTVLDRTPKSDTVIVLGDANAKLRKEDIYNEVSGKHTLHKLSNRNGEMLLEFALGNNLNIMSTQFQHKKIHKGMWLAPDQRTLNQIDHVMISNEKKELIEDVRTMRGPNIDSDHYLLKITLNQKLPKIYIKKNRDCTGMWNKSNLKNLIKCLEYRRALYTKLSKQTQQQDVEQEWEQIRMAITEAANKVIQKQDKKQRSEWWDKDCQLAIKRKNDARRMWLQHKTRASSKWYHKKRNEANRMCALKKKEWNNETIRQIEENHKKNESRKFFSEIKKLKQQNIRFPFMCKDEKSIIIITQTNHILNRWKDYFRTILNLDTDNSLSNHRIQPITSDNQTEVEIQPPSYNEVCSIINKLKSNKAGGTDNIIPELVKQGGKNSETKVI